MIAGRPCWRTLGRCVADDLFRLRRSGFTLIGNLKSFSLLKKGPAGGSNEIGACSSDTRSRLRKYGPANTHDGANPGGSGSVVISANHSRRRRASNIGQRRNYARGNGTSNLIRDRSFAVDSGSSSYE